MEEVLGIVAPVAKGDWSNLTEYEELNIVRHNNTLYIAKQTVPTGIEPSVSTNWADYWMLAISPISASDLINQMFPLEGNNIYISTNNTSPAQIYGGDWEQITERFLFAASDINSQDPIYGGGNTGGEFTHTLALNEMPTHRHHGMYWNGNSVSLNEGTSGYRLLWSGNLPEGKDDTNYFTTGYAYGNEPHNNMPPYLVVYIWKRIA